MRVYFDNNANTPICKKAKKAMEMWQCAYGNPSSDNNTGKAAQYVIDEFCKEVQMRTNASKVIITSGASEANSQALWTYLLGGGHIIISAIEHDSILNAVDRFGTQCTLVQPQADGRIHADDILAHISNDTVAVFCMYSNNETGVINDIDAIDKVLPQGIALHCDIVQGFGKWENSPQFLNSSKRAVSASISFHKLYGPTGCGALVGNNMFNPQAIIFGNQNDKLRGGTFNMIGIAGSLEALRDNFTGRHAKNQKMLMIKKKLFEYLAQYFTLISCEKYLSGDYQCIDSMGLIVYFNNAMINTASMIIIPSGGRLCNGRLKKYLFSNGFIISISSACNTERKEASHVLKAILGDNDDAGRGFIRVSFGDYNNLEQICEFARAIVQGIKSNNCWAG